MVELRSFAFIDQIQDQLAGYIGSTARGYYPLAGQAGFFLEVAPGIVINNITDVVFKNANVRVGAMVVERTYGMLEVHADSAAEVLQARDVVLDYLGLKESDRLKPKIMAVEIVERVDAHMLQIVNRFRAANMVKADDTIYVLEVVPASYAGYAANEAEKAADVRLLHAAVFGASGRVYLAGSTSDIQMAKTVIETALAALDGRAH